MFVFHVTRQANVAGILEYGLLARGPSHPLSPYHNYTGLHDQPVGVYFTVDENWQMWRWEEGMKDYEGSKLTPVVLIVCDIEPEQLIPDPHYPFPECLAFYCPDDVPAANIVRIIDLGSSDFPRDQQDILQELEPFPMPLVVQEDHSELSLPQALGL